MNDKIRILFIDIEGGTGGSSKSLYELIRGFDDNEINLEVYSKKNGPIINLYKKINIEYNVNKLIPKITSVKKNSRNILIYLKFFLYDWLISYGFRKQLIQDLNYFDVVHLNHESLFFLASWLKKKVKCKITLHIRTNLYKTIFSIWQTKIISKSCNGIIFITENEKNNFYKLGGNIENYKIIYNSVSANSFKIDNLSHISNKFFNVASVSNFSYLRGTDRLINIANELTLLGYGDKVRFIVAGNMNLPFSMIFLNFFLKFKVQNSFKNIVSNLKIKNMFIFLGHINNVSELLKHVDLTIKPTRDNNPWGRDIIESLYMGVPVISNGSKSPFIINNITGNLYYSFDSHKIAKQIIKYTEDKSLLEVMNSKCKNLINQKCNPTINSQIALEFWKNMLLKRS